MGVNCHGRYVGRGALVNSVRALQLVTADGGVTELSRERNAELFRAAFGGYGGLGVITEVELDLDQNDRIERRVQAVPLADYPSFFRTTILQDRTAVLHNADLVPPGYDAPLCVSWYRSAAPLTETRRLIPRSESFAAERATLSAIAGLPGGDWVRTHLVDPSRFRERAVMWRNFEASLDTRMLEPLGKSRSSWALQEYFIPVERFHAFAAKLAALLKQHGSDILNVSIRHSPADTAALLSWAPTEVFSFVLYYRQRPDSRSREAAGVWTRALIDAALEYGGRYYLPYLLHASVDQFRRSYPEAGRFTALKAQVDPANRFTNLLWNTYLPK
ncbi:MAG: D-arabinono,4-lactone oxidase family protein [Hydrocarboniphaga sp.]|uniref:D-arabinono-1,4-lactone oxidase n=1 Tax=Hydrocarboniphaga sp. TaxID=2033016 RepID=UPI002615FBD3|nr:D-arabinono-1,4-lactone oxidase [Hydrocarboniphaga sp.]MDB5972329.1 D-arabinono,4-lactone oxidase family protein [Hydrocarboniphaga sp.]